jgi:hypothetical protein
MLFQYPNILQLVNSSDNGHFIIYAFLLLESMLL